MKLILRGKGFKAKKGSAVQLQSREKIAVSVEGGAGNNSRQVVPDDTTLFGAADYGSSKDETFFEACTWLESDCEDDFFSVNGDVTPAITVSTIPRALKLPTLEAMLKAEPLKPPQTKLGDLLRQRREGGDGDADGLSRNSSSRAGEEASQCCIPGFARAISYRERRRRRCKSLK